ncbi:MAG: cytochrome c [Deltaproteobacteria bacterium]|nr:cytochrome c [Deltaproteobacteria bacterium]
MRWWVSLLVACSGPAPARPIPTTTCTAVAARCDLASDAREILQTRCASCHAAPSRGIVEMVTTCRMPPFGMPDAERARLVGWAACNAIQ